MSKDIDIKINSMIIGIYSRMSHNLVMHRITNNNNYLNIFLAQSAKVLVESGLPDDIIGRIINRSMEQADHEYKMYQNTNEILSYGGSQVTAEALIGHHCDLLQDLLNEKELMNDKEVKV